MTRWEPAQPNPNPASIQPHASSAKQRPNPYKPQPDVTATNKPARPTWNINFKFRYPR